MGNNIGLQVDNDTVKLAYVEEQQHNIEFIQNLNSMYLKNIFNWNSAVIFLFQCSLDQFLDYPTSQNISKIRKHFRNILQGDKFHIKTNRQTMNIIKANKKLEQALQAILMRGFELQHKERIERAVQSLNCLKQNESFFHFSSLFKLTELHFHFNNLTKQFCHTMPDQALLVMLRNGTSIHKIEENKLERVGGSIVGEKTILSILKFKFPKKSIHDLFFMAMESGNLKNIDMMVEDIYGKDTASLGLPCDMIAASFGKIGKMSKEQMAEQKDEDIARSLITAFAINTAILTSLMLNQSKIGHAIIMADTFHHDSFYCLVESILAVFAPGKQALFCKYSPFVGCLGSALEK